MKFFLKLTLLIALSCFNNPIYAQAQDSSEAYTLADVMPEFPGGVDAMYEFLDDYITYPRYCYKNGIKGRVVLQFIVNDSGLLEDIHVLFTPHLLLADEAVRILKLMPAWTPGKINGKPVKVKFTLPIRFEL